MSLKIWNDAIDLKLNSIEMYLAKKKSVNKRKIYKKIKFEWVILF